MINTHSPDVMQAAAATEGHRCRCSRCAEQRLVVLQLRLCSTPGAVSICKGSSEWTV